MYIFCYKDKKENTEEIQPFSSLNKAFTYAEIKYNKKPLMIYKGYYEIEDDESEMSVYKCKLNEALDMKENANEPQNEQSI